ncbi:MAG TPA: hypothetical protein VJT75_16000 [Thermoleophilaceae bacterium]|nr:hypothetical protein [Thermoleophilaceae bacterium]
MADPPQVTIEITTQSQTMEFGSLPQPQPPSITLNGAPLPAPSQPSFLPSGFQVVILDKTQDITQPAAIMSNEFQQMVVVDDQWGAYYQYMYEHVIKQLLTSGDPNNQLVILASYGMEGNAPPPNDACQTFLELGANGQLQQWIVDAVDAGSQEGNALTAWPVNYILVGAPDFTFGQGTEIWQSAPSGQQSVKSQLSVTVGNVGPPPTSPTSDA